MRRVEALRCALGEGVAGATGEGLWVRRTFIIEEEWGELLSHVELDVVGEHAEEDVGTDARGAVVITMGRTLRSTVL